MFFISKHYESMELKAFFWQVSVEFVTLLRFENWFNLARKSFNNTDLVFVSASGADGAFTDQINCGIS